VPAAAVIPAPIAYIKVVAVKKLVVEFLAGDRFPLFEPFTGSYQVSAVSRGEAFVFFGGCKVPPVIYCEQIRVFKAGFGL
jgi:hypothetical protein